MFVRQPRKVWTILRQTQVQTRHDFTVATEEAGQRVRRKPVNPNALQRNVRGLFDEPKGTMTRYMAHKFVASAASGGSLLGVETREQRMLLAVAAAATRRTSTLEPKRRR